VNQNSAEKKFSRNDILNSISSKESKDFSDKAETGFFHSSSTFYDKEKIIDIGN
jgi:hypothetical protein